MSPEFLALLLGLSLYIAAFIAEIVRSGIQIGVSKGQIEASWAISLRSNGHLPQGDPAAGATGDRAAGSGRNMSASSRTVRWALPSAIRNSSTVNNTIITLSGHTVEAIGMMMAIYLSIAFAIAAVMNVYNRAVQIKER